MAARRDSAIPGWALWAYIAASSLFARSAEDMWSFNDAKASTIPCPACSSITSADTITCTHFFRFRMWQITVQQLVECDNKVENFVCFADALLTIDQLSPEVNN
jgi:hypothetical protein